MALPPPALSVARSTYTGAPLVMDTARWASQIAPRIAGWCSMKVALARFSLAPTLSTRMVVISTKDGDLIAF